MFTLKFPSLLSFPKKLISPPSPRSPSEKEGKKKKNVCLVVPRKSSLIFFNVDRWRILTGWPKNGWFAAYHLLWKAFNYARRLDDKWFSRISGRKSLRAAHRKDVFILCCVTCHFVVIERKKKHSTGKIALLNWILRIHFGGDKLQSRWPYSFIYTLIRSQNTTHTVHDTLSLFAHVIKPFTSINPTGDNHKLSHKRRNPWMAPQPSIILVVASF